jgi:hypothetical protein
MFMKKKKRKKKKKKKTGNAPLSRVTGVRYEEDSMKEVSNNKK